MLNKLLPLGLACFLFGCGGSSDSASSNEISTSITSSPATVGFYLPNWQSPKGTLVTKNFQGDVLSTIEVEDINAYSYSSDALTYLVFEFIPLDSTVTCPSFTGCGRVARGDDNDVNDNALIDYQENTDSVLTYQTQAFMAPGANEVFFSPMSTLLVQKTLSAELASLSATSFNHVSHSALNDTQEKEIIANAYTYAAIVAPSLDSNFSLSDAFTDFVVNGKPDESWDLFNQLAKQYLSSNLFNEQGNVLIQSVVGDALQTLSSISTFSDWEQRTNDTPELESRDLLVNTRNVLAIARLQEGTFNEELDIKLSELENAFDDEAKNTLTVLSKVVNIVLSEYSPLSDNPPSSGVYILEDLTIEYSSSPYSWSIIGSFDGLPLNIDLSIPSFRISGVLGNRIEGVMNASIIDNDTILNVDVSDFVIELDGINDAVDETDTGIAELNTDIVIIKPDSEFTANLFVSFDRSITSSNSESTTLSSLELIGLYSSSVQTTGFHITAIETTPFIGEDNDDLVFSIELDMPIGGASDFVFGYVGNVTQLSDISSGDVYISINQNALDISVREVNDNISLVIKGQYGRWLDVKQSGSDYSGGLYFGDTKIGDVTSVRGLPGVQFDNGDFESLF
ncbi:hypothetical protein J8L70_04610 [Pseudoalteromonas sp. MMG010]|uniref:hypothetical protein n=1 Tax=Pseudoalteromonas sp. MMG010 TaxID=2822685 RepID=UPI001B3A5127|nr:hypothetical protein [Pseudoalteromonas sp. MMG010]MBQ4832517.1 hypothetical protein [Pseudoalteromonas sp. MMG010]